MASRRWPRFVAPLCGFLALAFGGALAGRSPVIGSSSPSAPAQATVAPGNIRVQGRIMYIDRNSDRSHPAAGLKLEIWDQDTRSVSVGEKLDETVTDANGYFVSKEISNFDRDGPTDQPEGTQDVYLKLFTDNGQVRVLDTVTHQEYSWPSYDIDARDGLLRNVPDGVVGMPPLYVMENTRDVEALWTFVNLVEGWTFLRDTTGAEPGTVTAYWSKTSSDGPRYDPALRIVHLRDADAGFASVVVQQEAYALLHNAYGELPAAWAECTAGPTENVTAASDEACAFAQGFATFYALAVYADPVFSSLSIRSVNLDAPTFGTAGWQDGDTVSGRIAGAFWDLDESDTTIETHDDFNDTFERLWQTIAASKPATMREWWTAWRAGGGDACAAVGSLYQNTIDYNTPPTIGPIPDIQLDEDTTTTVDLKAYADDAECPDGRLTYELTNAGDARAGIQLVPTGVISITPEANWFGATSATVRVSDGPAEATARLRVTVNAVNDCPVIKPRVPDVEKRYGEPIVLNLVPHGEDVEDPAFQLVWDVRLEEQDAQDVTVTGRGTTVLTFVLDPKITIERTVRAVLIVTDRDGCATEQPIALTWTDRPNQPPFIWEDRLQKEYTYPVNQKIDVDLRNVAVDSEDAPELLEWYVMNSDELSAQVGYRDGNRQVLQFDPEVDFVGSNLALLEVRDTDGASASTEITLTWKTREEYNNIAPRILRHLLSGKTAGLNATVCYDLADKAFDPDDPPSALRWFATDIEDTGVQVSGQGGQQLCIRSRTDFEGCVPARFVVRDHSGAEDAYEVRTCWRAIKNYVPFAAQR